MFGAPGSSGSQASVQSPLFHFPELPASYVLCVLFPPLAFHPTPENPMLLPAGWANVKNHWAVQPPALITQRIPNWKSFSNPGSSLLADTGMQGAYLGREGFAMVQVTFPRYTVVPIRGSQQQSYQVPTGYWLPHPVPWITFPLLGYKITY